MLTLTHWEGRLTTLPGRLECPGMRLLSAHDHEPPVFEGPGYIDIVSATEIEFTMFATPRDIGDAMRRLGVLQEDPYDSSNHFRLQATDYDGTDWACGWTAPRLKGLPTVGFPLTGELTSLVTHSSGHWVATDSSVELVFQPRLDLPMSLNMVTTTMIDGEEIQRKVSAGRHTMNVLGSEITFFHQPSEKSLWIRATTSDALSHPYLENWLSEPLRILLGQLIYPRFVARNFGNGSAQVWLRPSPRRNSGFSGLLGDHPLAVGDELWHYYASVLTLIAKARDDSGHPNFETHSLTRYFEEVIQATRGSRWVLCMTLASSVEGIVRLLDSQPTGSLPVESRLKDLERQGIVTSQGRIAWRDVRHAVMHGQLVSPWSTRDEDQRIRELADLLRRLTRELLRQSSVAGPP